MYCPGCGAEERQRSSQFCRTCGMDMRPVRTALETPDRITAAAVTAREEIGHAIAAKVKQMQSAEDLKRVTWEVLPVVSKFLESPEDKRLELMRAGVMTSTAGLGATLFFILIGLATQNEKLMIPAGVGIVAFLIGLGLIINGKFFTLQRQKAARGLAGKLAQETGAIPDGMPTRGLEASPDDPAIIPASVIEHTTHHLTDQKSVSRD